jgi:arylsulfatase
MKPGKKNMKPQGEAHRYTRRNFLSMVGTASGAAGASCLVNPEALAGAEARSRRSGELLPGSIPAPQGAPNIVLILLDDVGFGAAGTFGGPVQTPHIDQLAARGLRYNNFRVCAQCSPTRAALLTGRNDHSVGFGTVGYGTAPGYDWLWPKSCVSMAEVLRRNGFSTAAFGKWHNTPAWETNPVGPFDRWPTRLGFEYFYGFITGANDEWEPDLYRNTTAVEPPATPEQGYYLTNDLANDAIAWIQTHQSLAPDKPYFLYFATGATHEPQQVPKEWIEKYHGQFDQGWDKLREETFARQKRLGVIPANAELTERTKELPAWSSYSADEQKYLAHQMEVYAGYLAVTDHEVGRLLEAVRNSPDGDNTLILYIVGDNGASSEGGLGGSSHYQSPLPVEPVQYRLQHLDREGAPGSRDHYASAWAWAMCTPFRWQKLIASDYGGTTNPLVVSWPARIKDQGGLRNQFAHVNGVAATIYDVVGVRFPSVVDGVEQLPLVGASFADSFDSPAVPSHHHVQIFEQWGNRAIYQDGWIASARHTVPWQPTPKTDFYADRWELYHVAEDFSEAHDLSEKFPEKLKELQALFDAEALKYNIYPLGGSTGYNHPQLSGQRREFVFYPSLPRIPTWAAPDFTRSHRITADLVIPSGGAEGVIVTNGGRLGGFSLYVKDHHLIYESNFFAAEHDVITSSAPLPAGQVEAVYEFDRQDESNLQKGTGRLYINGQTAGQGQTHRPAASAFGSFNIGQARVSPVTSAYAMPFKFTGTIAKVRVELK